MEQDKDSPAGRGRGRPPFVPTDEMRARVSIAAGGGMSHEQIALAIGCCRQTLENCFAEELSIGAYGRRVGVLEALHAAAVKGSVAAARTYLHREPGLAPPPGQAGADAPAKIPAADEGKKARAHEDAKTAQTGTKWDGVLPNQPGSAPPKLALVKGQGS